MSRWSARIQNRGEDAKDAELSGLFRRYSTQRERFVSELQNAVRGLGGDPDKSGSVTGKLHRGWMDVKAAVSSHEPRAVLAECERGEDAAVKAYRQASEKDLQPSARAIVLRQMADVQSAHDDIRERRDSFVLADRH